MEEKVKDQILDYYNECSKAYKKYAELKDNSLMDINNGAMQAIRHMLYIMGEKIEGINN